MIRFVALAGGFIYTVLIGFGLGLYAEGSRLLGMATLSVVALLLASNALALQLTRETHGGEP